MNKSDVRYYDYWADLNFDLLDEIVKCVNYGDYIRLRTVCKNWSLQLPKNPKHVKNPWLVLPFDDENEIAPVFNFGENIYYDFELPEMQETIPRGSCYRWLITITIDGALWILNPFTRAQFGLPPLSTFPGVKAYRYNSLYRLVDYKKDMQTDYIQKIIISAPPDHDDQDFVAMALYGYESYDRKLAWCRIGDSRWTDVLDVPSAEKRCGYEDAIFHEGKMCVVDYRGQLLEFDMKTGLGGITVPTPPDLVHLDKLRMKRKYLVETPDGLVMVIRCLKDFPKHIIRGDDDVIYFCYKTFRFEIYKFNGGEWLKINSIGNQVILLGQNSSFCTTPDSFPDGMGNRIYFTDDCREYHSKQIAGHDIGVFNLEDESINHLYPDAHYIWPPPVWLLLEVH